MTGVALSFLISYILRQYVTSTFDFHTVCSHLLERFVVYEACRILGDLELPLLYVFSELPVALLAETLVQLERAATRMVKSGSLGPCYSPWCGLGKGRQQILCLTLEGPTHEPTQERLPVNLHHCECYCECARVLGMCSSRRSDRH